MYEELIKALRNVSEYDSGYAKLMHDAADAIEEMNRLHEAQRQNLIILMNEEPEPKWIPVTEQLPEKHEWVLVRSKLVKMKTDFISNDGTWYTTPEVTHWMLLPEPPKEET